MAISAIIAGFAFDHALFYATGGAAFAPVESTYTATRGVDDITSTRVGWTVGGGIEYAIQPNWSVRIEYRYTDYGSFDNTLTNASGGALSVRTHEADNAVRVGFSYKFDTSMPMAPIIAKY